MDTSHPVESMSNADVQSEGLLAGLEPMEVARDHKWFVFAVLSTIFWPIWAYVLGPVLGWKVAGGVTAAFTVIWVFNLVYVWVFIKVIIFAIEYAES